MKKLTVKPQKLTNVCTKNESYDHLHAKAFQNGLCTEKICNGSVMFPNKIGNEPRPKEEVLKLAKGFFDEYYQSIKRYEGEQHRLRWEQISKEIEETGTYELTVTELVYGAKLAWRNAPRCIGRIQWSKLQVFDARDITTTRGMFEAMLKHICYATNQGNLRSVITIYPQRRNGIPDMRIWNSQLLSYAGYRNPDGTITGDPANVEFTEICQKIGWKWPGNKWDILPLVFSANGKDPEWFDIPPEYVLEVKISHPEYKWFQDLGLQWYSLPAVANMLFDCGGLQFPSSPFNGWYMASEIAARDFCDQNRFNILEEVGQLMGLDTRTNMNLWKDKALVEINIAVLHSFQLRNITIVDHHTASESFMQHLENEQSLRGGCPADWIWIVPPLSGSITPAFHQEMSLYYLKPSYEYQNPAWVTHIWESDNDLSDMKIPKRKRKFKEIAWAVVFASKLFVKTISKRIKVTILYATETGKSEKFAKKLGQIFGFSFNVQVCCMSDYDVINIEHETMVLIVTSTFGNGDPPENGESFARDLFDLRVTLRPKRQEQSVYQNEQRMSFKRRSIITENRPSRVSQELSSTYRMSFKKSTSGTVDIIGPLNNIRFGVFALGSGAYPNFCAFGKHIDNLMDELGGKRLLPITCGDELDGQEQKFNSWATEIFKECCEKFCLKSEAAMLKATSALQTNSLPNVNELKMTKVVKEIDLASGLSKVLGKKTHTCVVKSSIKLHEENESHWTHQIAIDNEGNSALKYQPGDHVAIVPENREELVNDILARLKSLQMPDEPIQLMVLNKVHTLHGPVKTWEPDERLPEASMRTLLTKYLDITTPPTPNFLQMLADHTNDNNHKTRLEQLATDPQEYEEWKHWTYSHLPEVFEEFPSVQIEPALLLSQLPTLQSRFYSISSSPQVHENEIHVTVAVVVYNTKAGDGPLHFGVCSNYLKNLQSGDKIQCYTRNYNNFHLPEDPKKPIIMIGPGTGIAPFRGFWQHRLAMMKNNKETFGEMDLFFGCRTKLLDLYQDEKEEMINLGVLSKVYLALSRDSSVRKTYVHHILGVVAAEVFKKIVKEGGHFYVCGDCTMAECVQQKLKLIIKEQGKMSEKDVDDYMLQMRDENRYHEDIYGITLRTEKTLRDKLNLKIRTVPSGLMLARMKKDLT